ncbi:MAG TPA: MASE1 domain-containing protein [Planctomycetota bacterium]|nr:MASE1 domain-containing protein [Planctomycetota bacterium]
MTIAYYVSGKLGLRLARVHESATAVWPPTGIALAACLLFGVRAWPGILLGAFLVNLSTSGSWASSTGIAIGNTLEAVVGSLLVGRFAGGREAFGRPGDVFRFALVAAIVSTALSATFGVASLALTGQAAPADWGSIGLTWWLGDLGGDLVVAPLLIVWGAGGPIRWDRRRFIEGTCLLGVLILATWLVFGGRLVVSSRNYPIDFLCLPAVLWAAFRLGPRGTATALILFSAVALWGTLRQFGPFPREAQNETLLLLQAFLGVTSVTVLAVSAAVQERRRALEELAQKLEEVARLNTRLDAQKAEISTYHSLLTHDISNIAMAQLGLVERLQLQADGPLTPRQVDLLRRSNRQALEMIRMADNARMLARVRDQGLPTPDGSLNLREMVDRAVDFVRNLHYDRPFETTLDFPGEPLIPAPALLETVLINLLDNAVRHSPRGGVPKVRLRAALEGGRFSIRILGGAPSARESVGPLFEKGAVPPRSSGHGIGLVLVREVVERAGGAVAATTLNEEGVEVFEVDLSLPAAIHGEESDRGGRGVPGGVVPALSGDGGTRDRRDRRGP